MTDTAGLRLICAFVCFYFTMGLWSAATKSPTFDEPIHFYAGYTYLASGNFEMSRELPPVSKELAALPAYLLSRLHVIPPPRFMLPTETPMAGMDLLMHSPLSPRSMLLLGRTPMLILGVLTVLLIARWAYRLWGMPAAVVASGLAATEPTLIAHGSLITPDIALTLFFALTFYATWVYGERSSVRDLVLAGIALGAAIGSKFSAIVALPALATVTAGERSTHAWVLPWRRRSSAAKQRSTHVDTATFLACVCGVAVLAIVCFYAVHGLESFRNGLADQLRHASQGHMAFFWGSYSVHGWWSYFPAAILLKMPTLTLVAILVSLAVPWVGLPLRRRDALLLIVPPLLIVVAMTWGGINIGIRYVLPAFPFLLVIASRLGTFVACPAPVFRFVLAAMLAWNVGGTLRLAPHFLAAGNAIAGGPLGISRFLSDSNVDWGQDLAELKRYMVREQIPSLYLAYFGTVSPSEYGISYQYLPSFGSGDIQHVPTSAARDLVAISVTNLHGVYLADHDRYDWLRTRTPITTIGFSIYIYDLAADQDFHCRLAAIYAAAREYSYAAIEREKCARL